MLSLIALVVLIAIALQFRKTQEWLTGKLENFIEEKIQTRVDIGGVYITFPKSILIEDLYVEDLNQDTLIYSGRLKVNIALLKLLQSKVAASKISLSNFTGNIERTLPDSAFNFDFIINSFASETDTAVQDTTSNGMEISVGQIEMEDIRFSFNDEVSGNQATLNLGNLTVDMDRIDLENTVFEVAGVSLKDTEIRYAITKLVPDTTAEAEESSAFDLGVKEVELENVQFVMDNQPSGQKMDVFIGVFNADAEAFSLARQKIDLKELELNNSRIFYAMNPIPREDSLRMAAYASTDTTGEAVEPWQIEARQISLANNQLVFHNFYSDPQPAGLDFNHIAVDSLSLELEQVSYRGMDIGAQLNSFSFREQSGFALQDFSAEIVFTENEASLSNLYIKTPSSEIRNLIALEYPSLSSLGDDLGQLALTVNLSDSRIGFQDILYFSPGLRETPPFKENPSLQLTANARLNGRVNDLKVELLEIHAMTSTAFSASGTVKGLPEMDQARFDFPQVRITSAQRDLNRLFLPDSLARLYRLPERFTLTSTFRGAMDDFTAGADLTTSLGNITADLTMSPGEQYSGFVRVDRMQLGELLRNDTLYGPVSMEANINGEGLVFEKMNASFDLLVSTATFRQYQYDSLKLAGSIDDQIFNGEMSYQDSSLDFTFDGIVSLNPDSPRYELTLNLNGADLEALNFSQDPLTVRGKVTSDISGSNLNDINGDVGIREVLAIKGEETYRMDSLIFVSINEERNADISIESDFLSAKFKGSINLGDLPGAIMQHFDQFYDLRDVEQTDSLQIQDFEFEIDLHNPEMLTEVIAPQIERFVPGRITGSYNNLTKNLIIEALIPQVAYSGMEVDTVTFYLESDSAFLNLGTSIARFKLGSSEVENLAVVGQVNNNRIETRMQITDQNSREQYGIGGYFASDSGEYRFVIQPASVVLNYQNWSLPEDNYIAMSNKPLYVHNMSLSYNEQLLSVNSQINQQNDSTLAVNFNSFKLETLSNLLENETNILQGMLNGGINLRENSFTGKLSITDLAFMEAEIGNLALTASNTTENRITVEATLTGNNNDIGLSGYYETGDSLNNLNLTANFNRANLGSFQGPLQGTLSELQGLLSGSIKISGPTNDLDIAGELNFEQASFIVDYLGAPFEIDNQSIYFDNNGIRFNRFQLADAEGNPARIDGRILTETYTDFAFDLNVTANNFRALNTTQEDNELYYGTLALSAAIKITGSMSQPDVQMDIRIKPQTNLTYVLPQTTPVTVEVEGLVEFIDRDKSLNPIIRRAEQQEQDTLTAELTGMDLTANLTVEENATLQIIIDPAAGDNLVTRAASSSLSLNIDQVGNINLTGTFEIAEGSYHLSFYEFVKRQFEIQQGSQITWTGSPLDANLNITAIYNVETPPAPLALGETMDEWQRPLPVQVLLQMRDDLESPDIGFDLTVSEEATSGLAVQVRNQLNQMDEAEVNKQVFALLILKRFIASNPFETTAGGGLESTARNSVSKILTSQLNQLSKQIKGVNLNFDLQSYEAGQENRTELEISLQKSLFNDRLSVQVGGNVDIEGRDPSQRSNQVSNYIGDIIIEYKLNRTGNLLLEFFREESYETFISQDIVETGLGIIYKRDYDEFRELFKPNQTNEEESEP